MAVPEVIISEPCQVMPKLIITNPSRNACSDKATKKKRLRVGQPFFYSISCRNAPRIWVAALAPTIGPSVPRNPKVEAAPTIPVTRGPKSIESKMGT